MTFAVVLHLAYWQLTIIKLLVVLSVVPLGALVLGYVFLMKVMAHMQSRLGPMDSGGLASRPGLRENPFLPHGWFQLIGDFVKFVQKEDIFPALADRWVFALAPAVVIMSTFLLFVVVPAGPHLIAQNLDVGIFFALAVSSLSVLGVLMAGWASANKYSLMGALRAAGQLIAYELPMVLGIMGVVVQAGTMSLQGIVLAQAHGSIFGFGRLGEPFVISQFFGFLLFLAAAQAELIQTPFDMPLAESELVAGYLTEYSGLRYLLFYMAETASAFAFAAIAATLFLGGWYLPGIGPSRQLADVIGPFVLGAKIMLVAFLIYWIRFTYPRLREDQLQTFAWKYLIPLSLVNILVTGILKVVF